jgi:hypothetical protein
MHAQQALIIIVPIDGTIQITSPLIRFLIILSSIEQEHEEGIRTLNMNTDTSLGVIWEEAHCISRFTGNNERVNKN